MRPLPQTRHGRFTVKNFGPRLRQLALAGALLAAGAWTLGCGGGGAGSVTSSPPPPPSITVGITPSSGTLFLGGTLTFTATVSNTTDAVVAWSVNSISGGSAQVGTITADGVYMAPADLPPGGTIQVTATSHADSTKSSSASVTISSDVGISVSPASSAVCRARLWLRLLWLPWCASLRRIPGVPMASIRSASTSQTWPSLPVCWRSRA